MRIVLLFCCVLAIPAVDAATCNAVSGASRNSLLELYTSEGCSSCPPADRWLSHLPGDAGVVPLAFHVDYWDRLGWRDPFAQAAFSQRQRARNSGAGWIYTPQVMLDYARGAADRGIEVIIAGAGGAAHLPGMVASATPLPVIGVPVPLARLDGLDSLLSIVQMPAGVPVATVSIGGARNAGLLAVRILGSSDAALRARIAAFQDQLAETVRAKDAALQELHGKVTGQ